MPFYLVWCDGMTAIIWAKVTFISWFESLRIATTGIWTRFSKNLFKLSFESEVTRVSNNSFFSVKLSALTILVKFFSWICFSFSLFSQFLRSILLLESSPKKSIESLRFPSSQSSIPNFGTSWFDWLLNPALSPEIEKFSIKSQNDLGILF